jgi:hypothetical protein
VADDSADHRALGLETPDTPDVPSLHREPMRWLKWQRRADRVTTSDSPLRAAYRRERAIRLARLRSWALLSLRCSAVLKR